MKVCKIILLAATILFVMSAAAAANDFGWTRSFNIRAKADPAGFRTRLAARFDLSDVQVSALRNIFKSPADAYIMLRLGEMQGDLKTLSKERAIEAVNQYRINKNKGWDELAQSLGIETDSEEYRALKRNHDLQGEDNRDQVAYSGYGSGKDNL